MDGFKTYKDRVLKATGEESDIAWEQLPKQVATELLDRLTGTHSADNAAEPTTQRISDKTFVLNGRSYTFMETMQLASVGLQLLGIILTIIIACKIRK